MKPRHKNPGSFLATERSKAAAANVAGLTGRVALPSGAHFARFVEAFPFKLSELKKDAPFFPWALGT